MQRGMFRAQVNDAWELLKKLGLAGDRNWDPHYPEAAAAVFRGLSYFGIWEICFRKRFYHYQLADNSLILLRVESFEKARVAYAYYECPYDCQSYPDFLAKEDLEIRLVGDELRPEYEEYLMECRLKETVTPIRYDHDTEHYREGGHPASHIHFGHRSNIRVGTRKVLKPLSFVLFIIRQCYPDSWQALLPTKDAGRLVKNIRESLDDVRAVCWNPLDECEMVMV